MRVDAEGPIDRARHVAWCKERARAYFHAGDFTSAAGSMLSDMDKREDCKVNPSLALLAMIYVREHDREGLAAWIEGFR